MPSEPTDAVSDGSRMIDVVVRFQGVAASFGRRTTKPAGRTASQATACSSSAMLRAPWLRACRALDRRRERVAGDPAGRDHGDSNGSDRVVGHRDCTRISARQRTGSVPPSMIRLVRSDGISSGLSAASQCLQDGCCMAGADTASPVLPRRTFPSRRRNHGCIASHAARSTSNATRLRASLLNSTATRWIGCPKPRYLSA